MQREQVTAKQYHSEGKGDTANVPAAISPSAQVDALLGAVRESENNAGKALLALRELETTVARLQTEVNTLKTAAFGVLDAQWGPALE